MTKLLHGCLTVTATLNTVMSFDILVLLFCAVYILVCLGGHA